MEKNAYSFNFPKNLTAHPRVDIWVNDPFLKELYHAKFQTHPIDWHWEVAPQSWKLLLKKEKPEFLILDLSLVKQAPIEALHEIKSLSPLTEIIVLSDTDDVQVAISAFKAGISDYYLKPTNPETLLYAIQKLFSQKTLMPIDPTLQADLQVFSVTHLISIAETDLKMKELTINHLISVYEASGAIWLSPKNTSSSKPNSNEVTIDGVSFTKEIWGCRNKQADLEIERFQRTYPNIIGDSFHSHLTSHPEYWVRGDVAWIPLQHYTMGGIFLFGITKAITQPIQSRTEFLVRSLEVSFENHRRYIEAKQLTYIDDLTGLYNPRFLDHALTIALGNLKTAEDGFCILFIDIDKFKYVNDSYGHIIGSQMLSHVGRLLKSNLRTYDHIFRYGGDEFLAVLYGTDINKATEIAERIRKNAEARIFKFANHTIKITLSVGIARFPDHGKDKETLISLADKAMYHSKKHGRNQVIVAELESDV